MDEATGDPNLQIRASDGEKQSSSPVHESRLAALRRADVVLQGGYITTSGRTSPTLLQRSNSIRGSPSNSRSDLLAWPHSPHPRSPRASTPESLLATELIRASPRFKSTSGQFTRSGTLSRKGCGRVLKRGGTFCFLALVLWFALEWLYLSSFQQPAKNFGSSRADIVREGGLKDRSSAVLYERLLALAAHGLAENEFKPEPDDLWKETTQNDTTWLPCANQRPQEHIPPPLPEDSTGYIMINANGGLSQQRVAICNGVAVARMLNATLVLPRFVVSSVRRDSSQFKDLYVEDYFIDYLKDDVRIVKELPVELQSLDLDAIEAVVTEDDVPKEAEPSFYLKHILPLLLKTRVVLFEGFGNRLASDPVEFDIQKLRCRCNYHALKFVPELQRTGEVIAERMRDKHTRWGPIDDEFHVDAKPSRTALRPPETHVPKYLAVHMRFETDTAAYSSCKSGGGDTQTEELLAYLEEHFELLENLGQDEKLMLAELQSKRVVCPLTPEEGFPVVAALGFKRATRVYLAGAHMHSGDTKMASFKFLYPNLVTKEDLLSAEELQPFRNHSSQLAALDYMGCTSANVFVVTDSASQLSSLVAGDRSYHGAGHALTIRPSRKRLETLLDSNATIEWSRFEENVRNAIKETERGHAASARRPVKESIYGQPRRLGCMCGHPV